MGALGEDGEEIRVEVRVLVQIAQLLIRCLLCGGIWACRVPQELQHLLQEHRLVHVCVFVFVFVFVFVLILRSLMICDVQSMRVCVCVCEGMCQ